jgi:serine protease Do
MSSKGSLPLFLLVLLCANGSTAQQRQDTPLHRLNESLVGLSRKLTPTVVWVLSDGFRPLTAGAANSARSIQQVTGSGVILSADGYIITNSHVVEGSTRVQVQLSSDRAEQGKSSLQRSGPRVPATIVGRDQETDLALLKIEASDLPYLELGDSDDVKQGQLVFALGNPSGLQSSITMGTISAVARQLEADDRVVYLQTDAPIGPGNSGGPLIDVDGKVVGINTFIVSRSGGSEGLGFAVPSNIVRFVSDRLKLKGVVVRGDIGVEAQTITPALAAGLELPVTTGVVLVDVTPGRTGAIAGLQPGDIVLALNGKPMENARQFHVNMYQQEFSSIVTLDLLREGKKLSLRVVVLERPDSMERLSLLVNQRQHLIQRLAVLGFEINPNVLKELPLNPRRDTGVLVVSPAANPFGSGNELLPGDILYSVNREKIYTLDQLNKLLAALKAGSTAILQLERNGRLQYVEYSLP